MIIQGSALTPTQRALVLRAYVHRWTVENAHQTYGGKCPGCEQSAPFPLVTGTRGSATTPERTWTRAEWHAYHAPLTTDAEWIAAHAFHFVKDGSRLHGRYRHCEVAENRTPARSTTAPSHRLAR